MNNRENRLKKWMGGTRLRDMGLQQKIYNYSLESQKTRIKSMRLEKIFTEIMVKNSPNLARDINLET